MLKPQTPFYIFVFACLIGLTMPVLIQDGMFMDAVLYTSVAHNQSQDIGTFWFPQFSKYNVDNQSAFHEQPPLGFGIQSVFFRLFGSSMYVERGYTFLMLCITVILLHRLWKQIYVNSKYKSFSWLPILIWITIPQVFWSFSNNMLENTMGVFILAGASFIYGACSQHPINYYKLIASAVFIFLATLTKGIPGLFILAMPGLWWLITKRISFLQAILATFVMIVVIIVIYLILLIDHTSRESLRIYFFDRALFRIGENPTVNSRLFILGSLIQQLGGQILFCIIIYLFGRIKKLPMPASDEIKTALFFIATGICGSLPLMLTFVQKAFYYVPSLTFFAIGFGMIWVPVIKYYTELFNQSVKRIRIAFVVSLILLSGTVGYSISKIGETGRNKEILEDVYAMGSILPDHSCISLNSALWNDWELQTYMMRYYNICLDPQENHTYYVVRSKSKPKDDTYSKIIFRGIEYDVYSNEMQ